jgi:hypothetical protein
MIVMRMFSMEADHVGSAGHTGQVTQLATAQDSATQVSYIQLKLKITNFTLIFCKNNPNIVTL